jgi:hypothetical protein
MVYEYLSNYKYVSKYVNCSPPKRFGLFASEYNMLNIFIDKQARVVNMPMPIGIDVLYINK